MTDSCVEFLKEALPRLGFRWAGFRKVRSQVCKRIRRRYLALGLDSLPAYRAHLERNPGEWGVLDKLCRVTISRFFRDRAVFELLRDRILPDLTAGSGRTGGELIRIWSAGCASGEEAYSVVLCVRLGPASHSGARYEIVGTDVDEDLLERARAACYPEASLRELPAGWLDRAFRQSGSQLCLEEEFRRGTTWAVQDVRTESPSGRFDLILCRNLAFTYFDALTQQVCLSRLVRALKPGGYVVIGGHESIPRGEWRLEAVDRRGCILKHVG